MLQDLKENIFNLNGGLKVSIPVLASPPIPFDGIQEYLKGNGAAFY